VYKKRTQKHLFSLKIIKTSLEVTMETETLLFYSGWNCDGGNLSFQPNVSGSFWRRLMFLLLCVIFHRATHPFLFHLRQTHAVKPAHNGVPRDLETFPFARFFRSVEVFLDKDILLNIPHVLMIQITVRTSCCLVRKKACTVTKQYNFQFPFFFSIFFFVCYPLR
jgi:hypothetical protein